MKQTKSVTVGLRITEKMKAMIEEWSEATGITVQDYMRFAILRQIQEDSSRHEPTD